MNAAINVSMVATTSHPIAASTPVVSSRTMIPFAGAILASKRHSPLHSISKRGLEPVTYVTGRDRFASPQSGKKKPHRIGA
jgi:hypothetical protein